MEVSGEYHEIRPITLSWSVYHSRQLFYGKLYISSATAKVDSTSGALLVSAEVRTLQLYYAGLILYQLLAWDCARFAVLHGKCREDILTMFVIWQRVNRISCPNLR